MAGYVASEASDASGASAASGASDGDGGDEAGWLATGDLAVMDGDGYFQIIGRKSDVIVRQGRNIYPRDIEELFYEHNQVQEAAVVGVADQAGQCRITAFLVLRPGAAVNVEDLREHCRRRLEPDAVPDEFIFRSELPKTALGQVLTRVLRAEQRSATA
jgi:long-chain acyl-CoA synthetase